MEGDLGMGVLRIVRATVSIGTGTILGIVAGLFAGILTGIGLAILLGIL
jgi:hypothetical protein